MKRLNTSFHHLKIFKNKDPTRNNFCSKNKYSLINKRLQFICHVNNKKIVRLQSKKFHISFSHEYD